MKCNWWALFAPDETTDSHYRKELNETPKACSQHMVSPQTGVFAPAISFSTDPMWSLVGEGEYEWSTCEFGQKCQERQYMEVGASLARASPPIFLPCSFHP